MMNKAQLRQNLQMIEQIINSYQSFGQVTNLVAVTKTVGPLTMASLYDLGQRHFGENRPQVLLEKQAALAHLPQIVWHFIGHLQTRQVKSIIDKIDYLHSLDRQSLADEIQKRSPKLVNCFVQVNVSGEESKSGIHPDQVLPWIHSLKDHDKIRIVGLMTMAPQHASPDQITAYFSQLKALQEEVAKQEWLHAPCTETSMGMSGDYELAVKEGASFVRIGSTLFEGVKDPQNLLYLAYGSNMNSETLLAHCPDAVLVKQSLLQGYRLAFKGIPGRSYATLVADKFSSVPCIIWMIPSGDISKLDAYEAYPHLYDRHYVTVDGLRAVTYMMHPKYGLGIPSDDYIRGIKASYQAQSWPIKALDLALEESIQHHQNSQNIE